MFKLQRQAKRLFKEAVDPRDFIVGQPMYVVRARNLVYAMHKPTAKDTFLKAESSYDYDEIPASYGWVYDKSQASAFTREAAQNWVLSRAEAQHLLLTFEPANEAAVKLEADIRAKYQEESVEPRDFILANEHPKTWGDLNVGDVLFSETGSIVVITRQAKYSRYGSGPMYGSGPNTVFDEYNPCYAYTTNGGPFVQHYTRQASDEILGAALIGRAEDLGPDFWSLMKRKCAEYWPEQAQDVPEGFRVFDKSSVLESDPVRDFILNVSNVWSFIDAKYTGPKFYKGTLHIFCNGHEVAGFHWRPTDYSSIKEPDIDWMQAVLKRCDAKERYIPGHTDGLWTWLHRNKFRLTPKSWGANQYLPFSHENVLESFNPRDFILANGPTLENVCNEFGLKKTADDYNNDEQIWPGELNGFTIRFKSFRGQIPLNKEVINPGTGEALKGMDVSVVYTQDKYGYHNLRIDVDPGFRRTRFSRSSEGELAERLRWKLKMLRMIGRSQRSPNLKQLHRTLASFGFKLRESSQTEIEQKKLMEAEPVDPRQFILDQPTIAAVAQKWGLEYSGHWETLNPTTEHWSYAGTMKLPHPVTSQYDDPPVEIRSVRVKLYYYVMTFEARQGDEKVWHSIRLQLGSWKKAETLSDVEGKLAEELDVALMRIKQFLTRTKATTVDQLNASTHRFFNRGFPR